MNKNKIIKLVQEYIAKEKNTSDLRSAANSIANEFLYVTKQRNKARSKIYKVGDRVKFYTPSWCSAIIANGTVEKVGTSRIKISTENGTFNIPSTKVGKPQRVAAKWQKIMTI